MVNGGLASQTKENGLTAAQQVSVQRKRLLKAPTLAELDSSDSEVRLCSDSEERDSEFRVLTLADLPVFQAIKLGLKLIGLAGNKTEDYLLSLSKDQYNDHNI